MKYVVAAMDGKIEAPFVTQVCYEKTKPLVGS